MSVADCLDGLRHLHPQDRGYTWTKPDGTISSRIDLILFPNQWAHEMGRADTLPCPYSDHSAVTLSFQVPNTNLPGPSYWKLNVSILDEREYRARITALWRQWQTRRHEYDSIQMWWDLGKIKIRDETTRYCKARARGERSERHSALTKLALLRSEFDQGRTSVLTRMR